MTSERLVASGYRMDAAKLSQKANADSNGLSYTSRKHQRAACELIIGQVNSFS